MAKEFRLPDIGEGLTEAEIVRWLVPVGSHVDADQPVVEVETDKAVVEIPSPFGGTVLEHGGAEGEVIEVGAVLLVVGESESVESETVESEAVDDSTGSMEGVFEDPPAAKQGVAAPIVGTLDEEAEDLTAAETRLEVSASVSVKALPLVRKLARERGIDIATVVGTGPDGRITREDVMAATVKTPEPEVASGEPEAPAPAPTTPEEPAAASEEQEGTGRLRMSRLRRTIGANMSRSWAEIPHVTTFDDVDASRLLDVRLALSSRNHVKIPIEALVIKAVVPALEAFPEFNASIDGDELIVHPHHDIGIAVDTPDGLLVARIANASSMSVLDLAGEVVRLGEGAKARALAPDELSGQTFTISNIGAVGGGHGTPIVPYGTTAILSVGRARERVIVENGEVLVAPVMPLSLSYDHRVIDGAQGRRFMTIVMENLEEPALFLAG